jgi:hypothetical protein
MFEKSITAFALDSAFVPGAVGVGMVNIAGAAVSGTISGVMSINSSSQSSHHSQPITFSDITGS